MKIEKTFDLNHPRDVVWRNMNDVYVVADCLPGASIVEKLGDNRYKGRMSVKVGPMAAAFDGEIGIESKPQDWTAIVSGKGADARSSSRATGSMTYRVGEAATPGATRVDVVSDINLAGPLAQFGKGTVMQEIAGRITADFVRNFEAHLSAISDASGSSAPRPQLKPQSLDAGNLLWSVLRARIRAFFDKLFGRSSAGS
jgi:carbon monoxide dehydrogenase subunit G